MVRGRFGPSSPADIPGLYALAAPQPLGRLTLTSLTPILTGLVSAAATVYYTPHVGNVLPIYNGSVMVPTVFSELSNVLANSATGNAGPAAAVPNANYDFFVWNNAGTPTLTRGALWSKNATVTTPVASPGVVNWTGHGLVAGTPISFSGGVLPTGIVAGTTYFVISAGLGANSFEISATVGGAAINFTGSSSGTQTAVAGNDTARSTGTENDLQRVNGVLTNLNAIANGPGVGLGTYVGTGRTDSTGATVTFNLGGADTSAWVGLWNAYNRVAASVSSYDTTADATYTTATIRAARGSNTVRASFIRGLDVEAVWAEYVARIITVAASSAFGSVGIGLDATNAITGRRGLVIAKTAAVIESDCVGGFRGLPGLGFHFLQATEIGDGTNANTFRYCSGSTLYAVLTALSMY